MRGIREVRTSSRRPAPPHTRPRYVHMLMSAAPAPAGCPEHKIFRRNPRRSEARAYETALAAGPKLLPARAAPLRHPGPLAPFLDPQLPPTLLSPSWPASSPRNTSVREVQRRGWAGAEAAARRRNEPDDAQAPSSFPQRPTPSSASPLALITPNTSSRFALPLATCVGAAGGSREAEA